MTGGKMLSLTGGMSVVDEEQLFAGYDIESVRVPHDAAGDEVVRRHQDARFVFAEELWAWGGQGEMARLREFARSLGIPSVWWTDEDPEHTAAFMGQAEGFDVIATIDEDCFPAYRIHYPGAKLVWAPMAAQPALHAPAPCPPAPAGPWDFGLAANWYANGSRRWAYDILLRPILEGPWSVGLWCREGWSGWPDAVRMLRVGEVPYGRTADAYACCRAVLGLSNYGAPDYHPRTSACSARIFEALACGKPLLAAANPAYSRLGFVNEADRPGAGHFVWVDKASDTHYWAQQFMNEPEATAAMAARGRAFVLERHTFRNRLDAILEALAR